MQIATNLQLNTFLMQFRLATLKIFKCVRRVPTLPYIVYMICTYIIIIIIIHIPENIRIILQVDDTKEHIVTRYTNIL